MMDNGFPFTTEPNTLMEMIPPPSLLGDVKKKLGVDTTDGSLPEGTLTNTPWRKTGVRYASNEIYFDIIEEINGIVEP
jgi:AP-3 complex subunit mu